MRAILSGISAFTPAFDRTAGQSVTSLSEDDDIALNALRRAVAEWPEWKRRIRYYVIIWRDGRVERVEPEEIAAHEGTHSLSN